MVKVIGHRNCTDDYDVFLSPNGVEVDDNLFNRFIKLEEDLLKVKLELVDEIKRKLDLKRKIEAATSRRNKESILISNGWEISATLSYYTKNGITLKMHEAFEALKKENGL